MGRKISDQQQSVMSYAEMVEAEFLRLYRQYDVANAPEKRKSEIIDSFWGDIYTSVFKPDQPLLNNCKSKLQPNDIANVEDVVLIYISLCKRYGGVIKYNQFCNLVGYDRDTLYRWHKYNTGNGFVFSLSRDQKESEDSYTVVYVMKDKVVEYKGNSYKSGSAEYEFLSHRRYDVLKKLQLEMQDSNTNSLSNDTMGAAIRANNETDLGKLYEPKRMIQREQIRQALTADQLPTLELSENHTQFIEQSS